METVSKNLTIVSIDIKKSLDETLKKLSPILAKFGLSSYLTTKDKLEVLEIIVPPYQLKAVEEALDFNKIERIQREHKPKKQSK